MSLDPEGEKEWMVLIPLASVTDLGSSLVEGEGLSSTL
jgi:hypothetical protein